jgi:hypothetical protein
MVRGMGHDRLLLSNLQFAIIYNYPLFRFYVKLHCTRYIIAA